MEKKKLIDVAHVSARGSSFRITLPKKIVKKLDLKDGDIVGFYDDSGVKLSRMD
ncbi:MAG: AbrB/MazE/SpoVT family DNA-binding domain-containing protein [Candidatus Thermoplasmatota archaeon]|jgi:AbrB family looped-hinge helix DNA binding protein|nr:AbrB/MazE/SpoVT family DNA-binding domain-containing protein [Candidatus Thermoplasmatota archaeon]